MEEPPTLAQLLALIDAQQQRIDRLEAALGVAGPSPAVGRPSAAGTAGAIGGEGTGTARPAPRFTRRGMLVGAAAGTAGLIGASVLEPAGVAEAATTGTFTSSTGTPAVTATNTGPGSAVAASGAAGWTLKSSCTSTAATAIAIRGSIDAHPAAGTAVYGQSGTGTGVSGSATTGSGVLGTATGGIGVDGTSGSTAANAAAVRGTISSTGPGSYSAGVRGINNGTGGLGTGVYGSHAGSGWGLYGTSVSGVGVNGYSNSGTGVEGAAASGGYGVFGYTQDGNGYGVYGYAFDGTGVSGGSSSGAGVIASSSSGNGVSASSSSGTGVSASSSTGYGLYGNSPSNYAVVGVTHSGNGVYGQVDVAPQAGVVGRTTDASGNWAIYGFGNIGATGTKSAVVPAADGGGHMTLYCVESPECWFEDFGASQLVAGTAHVAIDPEFVQTIESTGYYVFVQAEGDCKGLSVQAKTATGFAVRELEGGASHVAFSYRIVGLRRDVVAPRLARTGGPAVPLARP